MQLCAELKQEHDLLIRLIRTVHGEYAHNKDVFAAGSAAYNDCLKLFKKLCVHALNAYLYFQNSVEADEMMRIFLPVFFGFLVTLGNGEWPKNLEGFSPSTAPRPPRTDSQMKWYKAFQAEAFPSTLGAGEFSYFEGSSPSLARSPMDEHYHRKLVDDFKARYRAGYKARATLQSLSISPATSYSPAEMLQSQRLLATLQQRPSNSPATSYSPSSFAIPSIFPATSYSPELLQSLQRLATLQQRPSNSPTTSYS
ncbi:hypothetical protein FRX31_031355 [Thalictrum thalictroides]|uniref:Uncharacterized protein n=1 Tax=Thalictrum thalictroides TaxID=46969 RepID=A0A7J6V2Z2_THATH|nr:hypothetical protein FRX31_031355 [Thalictrum thalictroides]